MSSLSGIWRATTRELIWIGQLLHHSMNTNCSFVRSPSTTSSHSLTLCFKNSRTSRKSQSEGSSLMPQLRCNRSRCYGPYESSEQSNVTLLCTNFRMYCCWRDSGSSFFTWLAFVPTWRWWSCHRIRQRLGETNFGSSGSLFGVDFSTLFRPGTIDKSFEHLELFRLVDEITDPLVRFHIWERCVRLSWWRLGDDIEVSLVHGIDLANFLTRGA